MRQLLSSVFQIRLAIWKRPAAIKSVLRFDEDPGARPTDIIQAGLAWWGNQQQDPCLLQPVKHWIQHLKRAINASLVTHSLPVIHI